MQQLHSSCMYVTDSWCEGDCVVLVLVGRTVEILQGLQQQIDKAVYKTNDKTPVNAPPGMALSWDMQCAGSTCVSYANSAQIVEIKPTNRSCAQTSPR